MYENEILVFLLASSVLVFILNYRRQLTLLPAYPLLIAAYISTWAAWFSTNAEHLIFPEFFNVIEHLGYCLNGLLLLTWCWLSMRNGRALKRD